MSGGIAERLFFVTGAASGIGRAACAWLLARGGLVAMLDRDEEGLASASRASWWRAEQGHRCRVDIRDEAGLRDAFAAAAHRFAAPLGGLVNSAGIARNRPFVDTTAALMREMFEVNVLGTFLASRAFFDLHRRTRGGPAAIVNVGSVSGLVGNTGRCAYGAAKGAVHQLTRTMASELAAYEIRVNAVSPGPVDTPMAREVNASPAARDAWVERIPMRRYATVEEVAEAIGFLVSPSARFVCGQILAVDGGFVSAGVDTAEQPFTNREERYEDG